MSVGTQTSWPARTRRARLTVECLEDRSLLAVIVLGSFPLSGGQEVPPNASAASGTATLTVDTTNLVFTAETTVSGIALGDVVGFHLHRGAVGVNGPIVVDLLAAAAFTSAGPNISHAAWNVPISSDMLASLLAGKGYLNVHTNAFMGGEIRGQVPAPPGGTPGALADVKSQVELTLGRTTFNPVTRRSRVKVTIHNHGPALEGPLTLVLRNLARRIKLRKASGLTAALVPAASPFRTILPPGGVLASGAMTSVVLEFNNPLQRRVRFGSQLFVGPGSA